MITITKQQAKQFILAKQGSVLEQLYTDGKLIIHHKKGSRSVPNEKIEIST